MAIDFATVLASSVVAALVSGLVSLRSSERRIQIENITQERAKWRERIRSNALLVHQSTRDSARLQELHLAFKLLLNPFDSEDQAILASITSLEEAQDPEVCLAEFEGRVAYLLKHDWERAKHEAKAWFSRRNPPERKLYEG